MSIITSSLLNYGVNLWSVGFEQNKVWQKLEIERIIPIRYAAHLNNNNNHDINMQRMDNFVFYARDLQPHAIEWCKCNQSKMVSQFKGVNTIQKSINNSSQRTAFNNKKK